MKNDAQRMLIQGMLDIAGVQIDGDRPFDIKVNDPRLYSAVLGGGTMGLGEAYMNGWWDCQALDQFFERVLSAGLEKQIRRNKALLWAAFKTRMLNPQRLTKAFEIGEHHYDIGNDLFVKMLDKGLNYSCGYWESADDPRPGPGGQAGPDLPQAGPARRDAGPRHRLRLGRLRHVRG